METDNIGAQSFLMTDGYAMAKRISRPTWVGLFLSLFVMLVVRQSVSYFWPTLTFTAAIWKETLLWVSAITLLFIIRRGERLPLTSIGLGTSCWWKSILWGLVIAVASAAAGGVLAALTGYGHGPGSAPFEKHPLMLINLFALPSGHDVGLFFPVI